MKNYTAAYSLLGCAMTLGICMISFADDTNIELQNELERAAPQMTPYVIASPSPMAWEKGHPERRHWSQYAFSAINEFFPQLDAATDMQLFCPNYEKLDRDQKIMAWTGIFVGTAHWESSWDPTERTFEDQGIDAITHQPVYSEGLLQLSYQDKLDNDTNDYCPFDWGKDKTLSITDLHRSIMNPYINLWCGIRTMADLITLNKKIVVAQGGYWSTLSPGGLVHTKVKSISAEVRNTMPFCGSHEHGNVLQETLTRWFNWKINRDLVNTYRKGFSEIEKLKSTPSPVPSGEQVQEPGSDQDQDE